MRQETQTWERLEEGGVGCIRIGSKCSLYNNTPYSLSTFTMIFGGELSLTSNAIPNHILFQSLESSRLICTLREEQRTTLHRFILLT